MKGIVILLTLRIICEAAKGDRERRPRNYSPDARPRRRFDRPVRSTGEFRYCSDFLNFRLKVLGLPHRTSWQVGSNQDTLWIPLAFGF